MKTIFKILEQILTVTVVLGWLVLYIRLHKHPKYGIIAWISTICLIIFMFYKSQHPENPNWPQRTEQTGAEMWEEQYGDY